MTSRTFIDTNILIYAIDFSEPKKQLISEQQILSISTLGKGVISTQVIQEFYSIATKKLKLNPVIARKHVDLLMSFEVIIVDMFLIKEAIDLSIGYTINFWDALVISSAARGRCDVLLTEDLNHGQVIKSVTMVNIFK